MNSDPLLPASLLVWAVVLLLPAAVLASVLSALLERTGPIRLRHWVEEAGGNLRRLYDAPVRFGVFRYLLSLLGRVTPLLLFLALTELLRVWGRAWPSLWAALVTIVLIACIEVCNRVLIARGPERALRLMTWPYRVALSSSRR